MQELWSTQGHSIQHFTFLVFRAWPILDQVESHQSKCRALVYNACETHFQQEASPLL